MTPLFAIAPRVQDRFLAAGKIVLFAILFALVAAFVGVLMYLSGLGHGFLLEQLEGNAAILTATLTVTWGLARLERRPFLEFGLGGRAPLRSIMHGAAAGVLLISAMLLVLQLCGCVSFHRSSVTDIGLIKYGLGYLFFFIFDAFAEETLNRGYPLVTLSRAISFWPAQIVMGLWFAFTHAFNPGENLLGLSTAAVFSLVLGYSFLRFGSLWFAISLHAGWDFAESFLFGVPDSGLTLPGSFLIGDISGPAWLSGGAAGPEGSLLMIPVFVFLIWFIRREGAPNGCQAS